VHAFHPDVRRLLATALAALALTIAALAVPPAVGELDLRLSGGGQAAPGAATAPAVRAEPSQPRWVADPLAPPAITTR
jgi:hypothetical protein